MTPQPALRCRTLWLPRRGHHPADCQDACAFAPSRGRAAVADGAAESAYSGLWARLLVEEFVGGEGEPAAWPGWIAPAQARWAEAVRRAPGAEPLPWYLEDRFNQGAFSTFLGLVLDGPTWRAQAVGDTCLFLVRDDELRVAFPLEEASQFGNTPWLIGSRTSPGEVPQRWGLSRQGDCRPGDRLWLMTDALARWFLGEREAGRRPWRELDLLFHEPDDRFADWVGQLRGRRQLRNDDTTLLGVWL
jgi:hypothetical protein